MKNLIIIVFILFGIFTIGAFAQTQTEIFGWEVTEFPGGYPTQDTAILEESQEIFSSFPSIPGYNNQNSLKITVTHNGTGWIFLKNTFSTTQVYPKSGVSFITKILNNPNNYLFISPMILYNNEWYYSSLSNVDNYYNNWWKIQPSEWINVNSGTPYPLDSLYADTCYIWLRYNYSGEYYFDTWYYYTTYPEGNLICGFGDVISGLEIINPQTPDSYSLLQNYPNPFNPNTKIQFTIPITGYTKLTIYNMLGQLVSTLVNQELVFGAYEYDFNAANLPNGNYFYNLTSGNYKVTKKMVLLK
jgi:hypothetical protein